MATPSINAVPLPVTLPFRVMFAPCAHNSPEFSTLLLMTSPPLVASSSAGIDNSVPPGIGIDIDIEHVCASGDDRALVDEDHYPLHLHSCPALATEPFIPSMVMVFANPPCQNKWNTVIHAQRARGFRSDSDDLQIEARLQPNDIDQVRVGQKAFIRFSAFDQRVTPQLVGLVSYVSADVSHDQQTNAAYFTARMTLPEDERRRLAGLQLVSGMPAEAFMQTGSRTMMSYLLKPITDQMQRAFVEQ